MINKKELEIINEYICKTCEKGNGNCPFPNEKKCPQLDILIARIEGEIKGR
jgi:hypothetical protein